MTQQRLQLSLKLHKLEKRLQYYPKTVHNVKDVQKKKE